MMPFGRGFGFRGWSPGWPYVGLGRGGLPRCWGFGGYGPYGDIWDAPYSQPYGFEAYPYGPSPYGWGDPYGYGYAPYGPMYQGYPNIPNPWGDPHGPPVMTAEAEMEWLKDQAGSIRQEIDQIKNRISELEKE